MIHATARWRRALALAALSIVLAAPAHAQQVIGTLAATCAPLDSNRELVVDTTLAVPARAAIVASVAGRADVLSDFTLVDPNASTWVAIGARRTRGSSPLGVAQLLAVQPSAVPGASQFRLRAAASAPGTPACLVLTAFADVATGQAALQSRAASGASGATPALVGGTPGDGTPQLLVASFAFASDPGSVSAGGSPGIVEASACAPGGTLCLGTLAGADPGTGTLTLGATLGNPVVWSGVFSSLDRETLLRDGFE